MKNILTRIATSIPKLTVKVNMKGIVYAAGKRMTLAVCATRQTRQGVGGSGGVESIIATYRRYNAQRQVKQLRWSIIDLNLDQSLVSETDNVPTIARWQVLGKTSFQNNLCKRFPSVDCKRPLIDAVELSSPRNTTLGVQSGDKCTI